MQALCLPLGASVSLLVMFFFFDSMQLLFAVCTASKSGGGGANKDSNAQIRFEHCEFESVSRLGLEPSQPLIGFQFDTIITQSVPVIHNYFNYLE